MVTMLAAIAEFETEIRKQRQLEGIAHAKKNGVYRGKAKSIDRDRFKELLNCGKNVREIMADMNISRSSFYKLKQELIL